MDTSHMIPQRPYLLRAIYDWLLDNRLTPNLLVNVLCDRVQVPMEFVRDGYIILNIAQNAVANLSIGNDKVCFNARFKGVVHYISVPIVAVKAIYARENGAGSLFDTEFTKTIDATIKNLSNNINSVQSLMSVIDGTYKESGESKTMQQSNSRSTLRVIK